MDKFSYYVDDNDQIKAMDHYQALKLEKSFFQNFDEQLFKKQIKALYLEYHPDKNPAHKVRSEAAFKRIIEATTIMLDASKRAQYLRDGTTENLTSQEEMDRYFKEWLKEKLDKLDLIIHQIGVISRPEQAEAQDNVFVLIEPSVALSLNNFQSLSEALKDLWKGTFVTQDEINKQFEAFDKLVAIAKTGNDFYQLMRITLQDPVLRFRSQHYLQQAAGLGHLIAMRTVAGSALSGMYIDPKENSLRWALNSIRYLEGVAIPNLERLGGAENQEILSDLRSGLTRARGRIDSGEYAAGKKIPAAESEEFRQLLATLNEKLKGEDGYKHFILSDDILLTIEHEELTEQTNLRLLAKMAENLKASKQSLAQQADSIIAPIPAEQIATIEPPPTPVPVQPTISTEEKNNLYIKTIAGNYAKPQPVTAGQEKECAVIVSKLLALTEEYQRNLDKTTTEGLKIQPILTDLVSFLKTTTNKPQDKIRDFYTFLDKTPTKNNALGLKNIDIIKQDTHKSALDFLLGLAIIAATIVTAVLPGLLVIGIVYAATGKHPLDLFKTDGDRFTKNIDMVKGHSRSTAAFFKSDSAPDAKDEPQPGSDVQPSK